MRCRAQQGKPTATVAAREAELTGRRDLLATLRVTVVMHVGPHILHARRRISVQCQARDGRSWGAWASGRHPVGRVAGKWDDRVGTGPQGRGEVHVPEAIHPQGAVRSHDEQYGRRHQGRPLRVGRVWQGRLRERRPGGFGRKAAECGRHVTPITRNPSSKRSIGVVEDVSYYFHVTS